MNIDKENIRFEIDIFNQTEMEYTSISCYLNRSPINQYRIDDTFSSLIKLKAIYKDFFYREIQHNWIFKLDITNKSLYRIIEDQIREEAKNNVYSAEDKELLKIFVKQKGHRTDDEIADIFNEKENNIIVPKIREENTIINNDSEILTGLIDPNEKPLKFSDNYPIKGFSLIDLFSFSEIIREMYRSAAIDGTKGEISNKNLYYNYIVPFDKVKNILMSDFSNLEYYRRFLYTYNNEYKYLLLCIYESLEKCPQFVRYLIPLEVNKDSNLTVEEAVNNYYDSISGRVSSEYQRRIDCFQKSKKIYKPWLKKLFSNIL